MKRILFLLFAGVLLTGCATSSSTSTPTLPPTAETPNPLPEPSDPTQLITVESGQTFELVLPSNPSTGYHWEIISLDENIAESVSQDYIPEQPVMPGSGGMDVWTFQAVNPGDTTLELGYFPPGNEADPDETVVFSIQVE